MIECNNHHNAVPVKISRLTVKWIFMQHIFILSDCLSGNFVRYSFITFNIVMKNWNVILITFVHLQKKLSTVIHWEVQFSYKLSHNVFSTFFPIYFLLLMTNKSDIVFSRPCEINRIEFFFRQDWCETKEMIGHWKKDLFM